MNIERLRHIISRILLALAYTAVVFEWLWLVIVGLPLLIETGLFETMTTTEPVVQTPHDNTESSPVTIAVVGVITVAVLAVTAFIIFKAPQTILRGGDAAVTHATKRAIPVITHHKTLPAKQRRELSRRLRLFFELAACFIPLIVIGLFPVPQGLTPFIVLAVTSVMAGMAFATFLISWILEPTKTTSRTRLRASRE